MPQFYRDCLRCQVTAMCGGSEEECSAYQEYFGLGVNAESAATVLEPLTGKESEPRAGVASTCGWINRLTGRIVSISRGEITIEITVQCGDVCVTSIMPVEKFPNTGLKVGDTVSVAIKAVNVTVMR